MRFSTDLRFGSGAVMELDCGRLEKDESSPPLDWPAAVEAGTGLRFEGVLLDD